MRKIEFHMGYAARGKDEEGKTGVYNGSYFSRGVTRYTKLYDKPVNFFTGENRYKGELQDFAFVKGVVFARHATKEDLKEWEQTEQALRGIHKQTVRDIMGDTTVHFVTEKLRENMNLSRRFNNALAGKEDMSRLHPIGAMILVRPDDQGKLRAFSRYGAKTVPLEEAVVMDRGRGDYYLDNTIYYRPYELLEKAVERYGSGNVFLAFAYMEVEDRHVSLGEVRRQMEYAADRAEREGVRIRGQMAEMSPG